MYPDDKLDIDRAEMCPRLLLSTLDLLDSHFLVNWCLSSCRRPVCHNFPYQNHSTCNRLSPAREKERKTRYPCTCEPFSNVKDTKTPQAMQTFCEDTAQLSVFIALLISVYFWNLGVALSHVSMNWRLIYTKILQNNMSMSYFNAADNCSSQRPPLSWRRHF